MTRLPCVLLIAVLVPALVPFHRGKEGGAASTTPEVTHYDLEVDVVPATKQLRVDATLTVVAPDHEIPSLRLFLHKELVVTHATVNGRPVAFSSILGRTSDAPGFSPTAVAVDLSLRPPLAARASVRVGLRYAGPISTTINGVNLISEPLTELALYSAWYPLLPGTGPFTYELAVTSPANGAAGAEGQPVCLSDGELVEHRAQGKTLLCRFRRERRASDVPLILSPRLKSCRVEARGFRAEVFHARVADAAAEDLARSAVDGYDHLVARLGAPAVPGRLQIVVSPRDGWGYSRVPLSVIPETYALKALSQPDGRFQLLHGNLHEVGHFWWQLADSETSDDWINESLAEFSALHACERLFGAGPVAGVLQAYEQDVRGITSPTAILATRRTDPNGYVLFYEKGALLWDRLRRKLGDDVLFDVLRHLHAAHRGTRSLTTAVLVETFAKETAGGTDAFFAEWLRGTTLPGS
jgi:hypothetical protein